MSKTKTDPKALAARQTTRAITRAEIEKKYLFKHYYSSTLKDQESLKTYLTLKTNESSAASSPDQDLQLIAESAIKDVFEKDQKILDAKIRELKKETPRRGGQETPRSAARPSGRGAAKWVKVVYSYQSGYSSKNASGSTAQTAKTPTQEASQNSLPLSNNTAKNIFTFEGKCIKVKNKGIHTKIVLENSLNIVQQFCVYASNILQLSIHTHSSVDIIYTHPLFKKRN